MKKKILLSSILTIALCISLITGATYALFTSDTEVNIAVTAGKLDVLATIGDDLVTWSLGETEADDRGGAFANGGEAVINDQGELIISRMTPGDTVKFTINVENNSNVALKYMVTGTATPYNDETKDLSDALVCTTRVNDSDEEVHDMNKDSKEFTTDWILVEAPGGEAEEITQITVIVTFPNGTAEHDNPFKGAATRIKFALEAVQANGIDANGELILP